MRFACWITKVTNTHSGYVILIVFPRQQWLFEGTSILRYMYNACRVKVFFHLHPTISVVSSLQVLQERNLYVYTITYLERYMLLQSHDL